MIDLLKYQARICQTAGGVVVDKGRALLVKHKKLGIWLAPGGHLDDGELPHQAALREVREETGVNARVISAGPVIDSPQSQYLPLPFVMSLHWVARDNYHQRLAGTTPAKPHATKLWPLGCEQHLCSLYLMQKTGSATPEFDPAESTAIGWFGIDQLDDLQTEADIRQEIRQALLIGGTIPS